MMRWSLWAFVLILLGGCEKCLVCQDPGRKEPPIVLGHNDSAAIATIKQSLGVWNGQVMDWVTNVADTQVTILKISNPYGRDVVFPDKGLELVGELFITCGRDSGFNVYGMERLSKLKEFGFGGDSGAKIGEWPHGIFLSKSIQTIRAGNSGYVSVPDSIAEFTLLADAFLIGNQFGHVPEVLMSMRSLRRVLLYGNRICAPTQAEIDWMNTYSPNWKGQVCN